MNGNPQVPKLLYIGHWQFLGEKKLHALLKDKTIIVIHLELTIADDSDLWLLRAQFCLVILGPVRLFAQVELSHCQIL